MKILNAGLMLAVVVGLFMAGCENTTTSDTAITVTPDSVELKGGATQVFTASVADTNVALNLPLVWTVGDSTLGLIKSSEGLTAVYESNGAIGNNTVTVRDQGEASGVAVINQR